MENSRVIPMLNKELPSKQEQEKKEKTIEKKEEDEDSEDEERGEESSKKSQNFDSNNCIGLFRTELKNGKILWLCKEHAIQTNGTVLEDFVEVGANASDLRSKVLAEIDKVDIEIE